MFYLLHVSLVFRILTCLFHLTCYIFIWIISKNVIFGFVLKDVYASIEYACAPHIQIRHPLSICAHPISRLGKNSYFCLFSYFSHDNWFCFTMFRLINFVKLFSMFVWIFLSCLVYFIIFPYVCDSIVIFSFLVYV